MLSVDITFCQACKGIVHPRDLRTYGHYSCRCQGGPFQPFTEVYDLKLKGAKHD